MSDVTETLRKMEFRSCRPGGGNIMEVINGKKVRAKTRMNPPASRGKGFTTLWYIDGNRVSKANLVDAILK